MAPKILNTSSYEFGQKYPEKTGSLYVSAKLPTYPSPKPALKLNSQLGQNVSLGKG